MGTIENAIDQYLSLFRQYGFVTIWNNDIVTTDKTLLFNNSTIVSFKEDIEKNKEIVPTAIVQACLRNNTDKNSLSFFNMVGVCASKAYLYESGKVLMQFLEMIGLHRRNIYCVVNQYDIELQAIWKEIGDVRNMYLISKEKAPYATYWQYGKGFHYFGRGLTLVYMQNEMEKCNDSCGLFCECNRHIQFGNIIIVNNGEREYLDIGLGLERILSCLYNNNIFELPEIKRCIASFPKRYDQYFTISKTEIYDIIRYLWKLYSCGIRVGNHKGNYIMKKGVRMLTEQFLFSTKIEMEEGIKNVEQYLKIYNNKEDFIKYILNEMKIISSSINKNIIKAQKWLKCDGQCFSKIQKNYILKERFGISEIIIKNFFEEELL